MDLLMSFKKDEDGDEKMSGGFLDPNSGELDRVGIKGALNGREGVMAVDYELVDPTGKGEPLKGRDDLPVGITLALVSFNCVFS